MKLTLFAKRRPVTAVMLIIVIASSIVVVLSKLRPELSPFNNPKVRACMGYLEARLDHVKMHAAGMLEPHSPEQEGPHREHPKIVVTSPLAKDVTITQQYVCQIRSRNYINLRALKNGYLEEIKVQEGQVVKKGDMLFRVVPSLYQAQLDAELAEAHLAEIELENTKNLFTKKVVSQTEVALHQAKLDRAKANANKAEAELYFTIVRAPFDGIIDRLQKQQGSLVQEGDILTTLSDNGVMWAYFNVPEARYLEYMADGDHHREGQRIELRLADGSKFPLAGKINAIEAKFDNETGNILFRADFPNPERLLRHGQTGDVLIHQDSKGALVIPQQATFEVLEKQYVFVVGEDDVVHLREIVVQDEMDDVFVLESGLDVHDKFVLEGIQHVREGNTVEYEFRTPEEAMANQKKHAE